MTRSEIPKASSDLVCARLTDVIFGDSAINYEEGKWAVEKGVKVFKPEFRMIEGKAGEISSFAQNRREPKYKYGTYISGSAVRQDAEEIFSQLGENVRMTYSIRSGT